MSVRRALRHVALAGAVALAATPAADAAILDRFGIYASYWEASLEGDARIDGATPGAPYELDQAVGLDGDDGIMEFGGWFHPVGRHRLRFSALSGSFDGGTTLSRSLDLGGVVVPPATPVASSIDLEIYRGLYGYSFVNLDLVNVGVLVGVDYVDAENRLEADSSVYAARLKGGVPVVGVAAQFSPVGFFRLYGEALYANWDVGGLDASIRDLSLRVEFYVAHALGIGAGYRELELEVAEGGQGWIDTESQGYQVFLLLRF